MKARVHVMLKDGVLDPQGEAVRHALGTLGFDGVNGVRQGKVIELDLDASDKAECRSAGRCDVPEAARQYRDRTLRRGNSDMKAAVHGLSGVQLRPRSGRGVPQASGPTSRWSGTRRRCCQKAQI